ncbi:MAG: hypothetical protein P8Y14_21680 [Anaerolineales bacterium]
MQNARHMGMRRLRPDLYIFPVAQATPVASNREDDPLPGQPRRTWGGGDYKGPDDSAPLAA